MLSNMSDGRAFAAWFPFVNGHARRDPAAASVSIARRKKGEWPHAFATLALAELLLLGLWLLIAITSAGAIGCRAVHRRAAAAESDPIGAGRRDSADGGRDRLHAARYAAAADTPEAPQGRALGLARARARLAACRCAAPRWSCTRTSCRCCSQHALVASARHARAVDPRARLSAAAPLARTASSASSMPTATSRCSASRSRAGCAARVCSSARSRSRPRRARFRSPAPSSSRRCRHHVAARSRRDARPPQPGSHGRSTAAGRQAGRSARRLRCSRARSMSRPPVSKGTDLSVRAPRCGGRASRIC